MSVDPCDPWYGLDWVDLSSSRRLRRRIDRSRGSAAPFFSWKTPIPPIHTVPWPLSSISGMCRDTNIEYKHRQSSSVKMAMLDEDRECSMREAEDANPQNVMCRCCTHNGLSFGSSMLEQNGLN